MTRPSGRNNNQLRTIHTYHHYTKHAEGSVLITFEDTKVLCTASVISGVPRFLKDAEKGWVTAEYGMLPRATHSRMDREAARGKQSPRTQEIQRLIGRALRAVVDLGAFPGYTIRVDCDVIQADGGTRTAAISGAGAALKDAFAHMQRQGLINRDSNPLKANVASVSVGIYNGEVILDLDYEEDSQADTDMNVVMTDKGGIIEIQGTAEGDTFSQNQLMAMLENAKSGIDFIIGKLYVTDA